jgi:DNA-binding LytR/AlgR family response regulator
MSKLKIAYIDEEEDGRDTFELYFEQFDDLFEVVCILPSSKSVNDIVDEIIEINPDLVVVDYYLKYTDPTVPANGDVVLQRINDRKPLLPVIIFTSYSAAAKNSFLSPDKKRSIHTKMEIVDPYNTDFRDTVKEYIDYYKKLIDHYKSEFASLSQKEKLEDEESGRLRELDIILEGYSDQQNAYSPHEKSDEKFENLMKLIDSTQELLKSIKKKKDNGQV